MHPDAIIATAPTNKINQIGNFHHIRFLNAKAPCVIRKMTRVTNVFGSRKNKLQTNE